MSQCPWNLVLDTFNIKLSCLRHFFAELKEALIARVTLSHPDPAKVLY